MAKQITTTTSNKGEGEEEVIDRFGTTLGQVQGEGEGEEKVKVKGEGSSTSTDGGKKWVMGSDAGFELSCVSDSRGPCR